MYAHTFTFTDIDMFIHICAWYTCTYAFVHVYEGKGATLASAVYTVVVLFLIVLYPASAYVAGSLQVYFWERQYGRVWGCDVRRSEWGHGGGVKAIHW